MKRIFLALGLVLAAAAPAGAVSTLTISLTQSWQDLGVGPLQIQTNNQSQTIYQIGDSTPTAGSGGFFLQGNSVPQVVSTTSHVYARVRLPSSALLTYSPVTVATSSGGSGGGGSSTITSPTGSNTKAQSVSVTYATDQLLPAFAAAPTVVLGAGTAAVGSITNTAFGISGTLPAFASTPTFNIGSGSIGNAGFAAYGPDAVGAAPTRPPLYNGFLDANGNVLGASPTTRLPAHDYDQRAASQSLSATNGSFIDIPLNGTSTAGLRFAGLTASGATISYFISNDPAQTPVDTISSLNAGTGVSSPTRTTDGSTRIAVGGHATLRLQVTTGGTGTITVSWNLSGAGSIVDLRSPLPPGTNTVGATFPAPGTCVDTVRTLTSTSFTLLAAGTYKSVTYMNIGTSPFTFVEGTAAAVVGNGMALNGATAAGMQGGSYNYTTPPSNAVQAISAAGTTVIVKVCN